MPEGVEGLDEVSLTEAVQLVFTPMSAVAGSQATVVSVVSRRGAVIVRDREVEWVAPPPEASIVTLASPVVAVAVAENDTVTVHVGLH